MASDNSGLLGSNSSGSGFFTLREDRTDMNSTIALALAYMAVQEENEKRERLARQLFIVVVVVALIMGFFTLGVSIASIVIGAKYRDGTHADEALINDCAHDTLMRPAIWLIAYGTVTISFGLLIHCLRPSAEEAPYASETRAVVIGCVTVIGAIVNAALVIVGSVVYYRDNSHCTIHELDVMMRIAVIWGIIRSSFEMIGLCQSCAKSTNA